MYEIMPRVMNLKARESRIEGYVRECRQRVVDVRVGEEEAVDVQDSGAVKVDAVEVGANLIAGGRADQYVDAIVGQTGGRLTWGRICSGRPCSWEG